jgi:hypothetical protein
MAESYSTIGNIDRGFLEAADFQKLATSHKAARRHARAAEADD